MEDLFYDTALEIFVVISVTLNLYLIIPTIFVFRYRHIDHIRLRGWFLIILQALVCLPLVNPWISRLKFTNIIGAKNPLFMEAFDCQKQLVFSYLFLPLAFFLHFVRTALYVLNYYHQKNIFSKAANQVQITRLQRLDHLVLAFFRYVYVNYNEPRPHTLECGETTKIGVENIGKVKIKALIKSIALFFLLEIVLLLVGIAPFYSQQVPFCDPWAAFYPLYAFIGVLVFITPFLLYSIRNMTDNFGICTELTICVAIVPLFFGLYALTAIPDIWPVMYHYVGDSIWPLFLWIIIHLISCVLPVIKSVRHVRQFKAQLKFPRSKIVLDDVFDDQVLWKKLEARLLSDYAGENAQFINEYRDLIQKSTGSSEISQYSKRKSAQTINILSHQHIHNQILQLYHRFIVAGAPCELNISGQTRTYVSKQILSSNSSTTGLLKPSVLEMVFTEVKMNIEMNSWPRFLSTLDNQ